MPSNPGIFLARTMLVVLAVLGPTATAGAEERPLLPDSGPTVLGLSFRGSHRAYLADQFDSPSVVNDRIHRQEVAVFYDGDRGLAKAYFRMVIGEPIVFAERTTGTVADDLTTMTRWDLSSGKAVAGNLMGMELVPLPLSTTTQAKWQALHPDTTFFPAEP